jgi:hypothetical protein
VRLMLPLALVVLACHQPSSEAPSPSGASRAPTQGPPAISTVQLSAPTAPAADTMAAERHVTVNGDMDIRVALSTIADAGGFSIVMPPNLKRRVQVHLVDVPVSQALEEVLRAADLTISGGTPPTTNWNSSVVFYQLPVNIDSLSVEAIMRRFSVTRPIAELIVQDRKRP